VLALYLATRNIFKREFIPGFEPFDAFYASDDVCMRKSGTY
jgi:hypothetical protein